MKEVSQQSGMIKKFGGMYKQVEAGEGCGRQRLSLENSATFVKTRDLFH